MQIIKSGFRPGLLEGNVPGRSVNSSQLERWLGADALNSVSTMMKDWYGPPVALKGVPGKVFAHRGGDFRGELRAGYEASALDYARDVLKRMDRAIKIVSKRQALQMNAGFTSLSDLISEATIGKKRTFNFQKNGPTGVVGSCHSLWRVGNWPASGAAGAAAPGGTANVDSTTGGFLFTNPTGGDTQHFVRFDPISSVAGNTLLMYDRLFSVAKTIASATNEAVTGVPTRYQSSTATDMDYAGGNFLFMEVGATAYANTAHNWGVAGGSNECLYRNQAGTDNSIMPVLAGNPGGVATIADRLDMPNGTWFAPLAAADVGVMDLAQMRCSASVATGALNFVIGHPIAIIPCPLANISCTYDGINTAFNLERVFDDACIAFLELNKPSTSATNYNGTFTTVAG
jgi:hypothetical protein